MFNIFKFNFALGGEILVANLEKGLSSLELQTFCSIRWQNIDHLTHMISASHSKKFSSLSGPVEKITKQLGSKKNALF